MTGLAARVLSDLRRLRLVRAGDRVVVALSGGPDSVALARLMVDVLPALDATLAGVVHVNHGLRGADADADEAFCRGLAADLGCECLVERHDVAAFAGEHGLSIEHAGHRVRAACYRRARDRFAANLVATGHTLNDLAETFLMRALRGAGRRGLGGIRPARPGLIRPLLKVARRDIVEYLDERHQVFREDATNRDTRIPRNRVRHELMPWLEAQVSPRAVEALARAARLAAVDDAFLERLATRVGSRFVLERDGRIDIDAGRLAGLPRALGHRVVWTALDRLAPGLTTAKAVETVFELIRRADKGTVHVAGGVQVATVEGLLRLGPGAGEGRGRRTAITVAPAPLPLPVPGSVELEGGRIEAERAVGAFSGKAADACEAVLDAARVREPLSVRHRRPGDRVRPLGMSGRKKLQDVFVDRKVPRPQRDGVPLVVDADGRIVWVAGHVVAEEARVTSATTSVLVLKYRR